MPLGLQASGSDTLLIKTFGESHAQLRKCDIVQLAIETPRDGRVYVTAYVVPTICSPISNQSIDLHQHQYSHLQSLKLADEITHSSDLHIDLLIGADYYWSLVTGEVVRGHSSSGPVALSTKIGYVLSGPDQATSYANDSTVNLSETHVLKVMSEVVQENILEREIKAFWDLESLGIKSNEPAVYDKFLKDITFDGIRYEVRLPFKETHPQCLTITSSVRRDWKASSDPSNQIQNYFGSMIKSFRNSLKITLLNQYLMAILRHHQQRFITCLIEQLYAQIRRRLSFALSTTHLQRRMVRV